MEIERDWRKIPKTSESREENLQTQPLREFKIFNQPEVVTEAWYPVVASRKLKAKQASSFKIGAQRLVVFRGEDGVARALDAFCPHMGADLGRGEVVGSEIRCYFHRWKFDGSGQLTDVPCLNKLPFSLKTQSYPVEEKYGMVWVFSGSTANYPVPQPPGLDGEEVVGTYLLKTKLFVHHHVLMASAIDLQHFASVHDLHADFEYTAQENSESQFEWHVHGKLDLSVWRQRLASLLIGGSFSYRALFAGGSIVSLTYGDGIQFKPQFHLLWAATPTADGLSEVSIFVVQKKSRGLFGRVKFGLKLGATLALLAWLKDDDVKAFPRMRFQAQNLIAADASVAKLVSLTEKLKRSAWSYKN